MVSTLSQSKQDTENTNSMGNKQSCCIYHSPKGRNRKRQEVYQTSQSDPVEQGHHHIHHGNLVHQPQSSVSLSAVPQHISEREPEGTYIFMNDCF